MVKIQVQGDRCTATLSEPDEEGCHSWVAFCGARSDGWAFLEDTVQDAMIHVDVQCEGGE